MKDYLTADKAHSLATHPDTLQAVAEHEAQLNNTAMESVLKRIEEAASQGDHHVRVGAMYKRLADQLRALGYTLAIDDEPEPGIAYAMHIKEFGMRISWAKNG